MIPSPRRRDLAAPLAIAFVAAIGVYATSFVAPYGYFRDEFYYIACAKRLAWGYVDHPPLSIFVLAGLRAALGDALAVVRLAPTIVFGGVVFVTALLARALGGGRFGVGLAAVATAGSPVFAALCSFYSMNSLELLLFAVLAWLVLRLLDGADPRLWIVAGAVGGLGVFNKHTFAVFGAGLLLGLLVSPARGELKRRQFWLGAGVAALIVLPNVLWQSANGWPSLEFYRNAQLYKNAPASPLSMFGEQVFVMNPLCAALWIPGLLFLIASRRAARRRALGWAFLFAFVVLFVSRSARADRLAAAYPPLLAAGVVLFSQWTDRAGLRWLRVALPTLIVVFALAAAPLALPVFPPDRAGSYAAALGRGGREVERGHAPPIEQLLADRIGWPELALDVARAVEMLTPEERAHAIVFTENYGEAGALELLGAPLKLPPTYCGHNSYSFWGPPPDDTRVMLSIGPDADDLQVDFEKVEDSGVVHTCYGCMDYENDLPILISRGPRRPIRVLWPKARFFI